MVAYLFAGQGAQYVGMGKDLYETFPESRAVFDQAEKILGWEIKKRCFEGPEHLLKMTNICQPVILTVSIAALAAFKSRSNNPADYLAGLSLGEYSALVASGSLKFEDALRLVRKRAELMEEAAISRPGKMAAVIGLDREEVRKICLALADLEIANLNAPGQTVISGAKEAVDKAKTLALEKGAKLAVDLEVSGAFHSSFMWEAAMEFKSFLEDIAFTIPKIPVISNVDARPKHNIAGLKESLVQQIYRPVLWEDAMKFILSQGITNFFEFGPGKVLKGLMRRIDANAEVVNIEKKEDILNLAI